MRINLSDGVVEVTINLRRTRDSYSVTVYVRGRQDRACITMHGRNLSKRDLDVWARECEAFARKLPISESVRSAVQAFEYAQHDTRRIAC